ncbi:condensation domain-containing protein [Streptomyces sp. NPDC059467]|uniref:condensation domain-containing protein n=1 Tax=Streptomyces sp. NPDC059467 TaxID=3346844 RepID=UPI0036957B2A
MSPDAFDRLPGVTPAQRALLRSRLTARATGPELRPVPRDGDRPVFPMTSAQQRFWFAHQNAPGSAHDNVPLICDLSGELDRDALTAAVQALVARHEILRTRFLADDRATGTAVFQQRVLPPDGGPVLVTAEVADEAHARRMAAELADRPFDLTQDPPLRATLLAMGPGRHRLVLVFHHIAFDAWSERVLWDELSAAYTAHGTDRPALEVQYGDYAHWQRERADAPAVRRHLEYWRGRLDGLVETDLPTDRPRPPLHNPAAERLRVTFDQELSQRLRTHCRSTGITPFTTVLTAFMAVLHRWTGARDLAVGSLVAGRTHPLTEGLIGPFLNTVVLRGELPPGATLGRLLDQHHASVLDALTHQDAPFERVVDALRPLRDPSRHPLFQVLFQVDGATTESMHRLSLGDVRVQPVAPEGSAVGVDLVVGVTDEAEGLAVVVEYRTDLYDRDTVRRLTDHLRLMLTACVDRPDTPVTAVDLTDAADRALLAAWEKPPVASGPRPAGLPASWGAVQAGPLPGTPVRVLGPDRRAVPVGAVGELHLDGAPTGRLARFTGGGRLELRGRADEATVLHGIHTDPGLIEEALARLPGVTAAALTIGHRPDGKPRITGYVSGEGLTGHEVRQALGAELPGYLLPDTVVVLEAIPLTPQGRPDLAALPLPGPESPAGTEGTGGHRERILADLVAGILRLPEVAPDDSFFDLGGDSILALQLVIQARREGLAITPRDIFRHRTPAALARVAKEQAPVTTDEPASAATGTVPLTPIMHWLRELEGPTDHYHQSVLLRTPAGLRADLLGTAVASLLECHDMLRARLVRGDAHRWTLDVPPADGVAARRLLRRVDASGLAGPALRALLDRESAAVGDRLAPADGVMFQAVWFDAGPAMPGRLLLAAHHLVVDAVSWRIIVPDTEAAYRAAEAGVTPALERPATSFRSWARHLRREAGTPARTAELPAWTRLLGETVPARAARELDPARDVVRTARSLTMELAASDTAALLTDVPAAFHAQVNEVLLAALTLAVTDWRHRRGDASTGGVLVDVESHGRQDTEGIDLSRTVGWFTSVYPLRLDAGPVDLAEVWSGGVAAGRAVKRVKEQVRAVVDGGLGHGLLRHLNADTAPVLARLARPEIAFNYLGRFTATATTTSTEATDGITGWGPAPEQALPGGDSDPDMPLAHPLELTAAVRDLPAGPTLGATWSWPSALLDEKDVRDLAATWFRALRALADHVRRPDAGGFTPSDVPLAGLDQKQIELLEAAWRTTR